MSLGVAFLALFLAVGAILAGVLFIVAAVALTLFVGGWMGDRAYRRHRKWVDGLCQGKDPNAK